jgi:predicted kinase
MTSSIRHRGAIAINVPEFGAPLENMLAIFSDEQNAILNERFLKIGRDVSRCPRIIIPIGPPGCGKSTWVSRYLMATPDRETVILSSDEYIDRHSAENGITYDKSYEMMDLGAVEKDLAARMRVAIAERKDIINDRTNLRTKVRNRWLSQVPKHYVRIALVFNVPEPTIRERVKARAQATGKNIPYSVITDMLTSYQPPSLEEFDIIEEMDATSMVSYAN